VKISRKASAWLFDTGNVADGSKFTQETSPSLPCSLRDTATINAGVICRQDGSPEPPNGHIPPAHAVIAMCVLAGTPDENHRLKPWRYAGVLVTHIEVILYFVHYHLHLSQTHCYILNIHISIDIAD
jgi:hypothetical protein